MSSTPYDDVFRTLLTDCTELMIPVVNEIFHTDYTGNEKIRLLQNEHFIQMPDGSKQERITDSSFEIISGNTCNIKCKKRYHIECQSFEDGSMVVRMFEYDTQIALENRELTPDTLTVSFHDSAIISLRHTSHTPDEMNINILTPGGNVSYNVPVLKVRQYSADELFEKHLFFLIPFHIFVYEKDFNEIEQNDEKLKKLEAEYTYITKHLNEASHAGILSEYTKAAILEMSRKVVKHLAAKYKKIKKGVNLNMGGKVLNYRAKDILNRGHAEGFIEGEEQTKIQIATKLLTCGNDIKSVADITELPEETVSKLAEKI